MQVDGLVQRVNNRTGNEAHASESSGWYARTQMCRPQVSNLVGLGWELAFLTSSLVKLMVLVQGSHFKNL